MAADRTAARTGGSSRVATSPRSGPEGHMDGLNDPRRSPGLTTGARQVGDLIFSRLATAAGLTIVVAIGLIAIFLLLQAIPSLFANNANFFTSAEFSTS